MPGRLDAIDWKILKELQDDGRMTNVELARRVGISAPPCLRRVRALEEAGFIKGYRALLDEKRLGYEVTLFTTAQACPHAGLRAPDIVYLHIGSLNAASLAMHRRLRARPATEHVPILLVSDPLAKKELAFRLKLGIHDFLISSDLVRSEPFWDELNADSQRRGEQALI